MRLLEIFRFEVAYRFRRLSILLYLGVVIFLSIVAVSDVMMQEARGSGSIHADAPYLVAGSVVFLSLLTLVITAAIFGDAAARDVQSGMHPLIYTMPLRRLEYLGGRFLGAFAVNALLLAVVPVVLIVASFLSRDSGLFGPFRLAAFLQPYFLFTLPTLLASGAIVFVPAALTRRAVAAFAAGLLLFLASLVSVEVLSQRVSYRAVAALVDPFAYSAARDVTAYWTPSERNERLVAAEGVLLWNRLGWSAAGAALFAFLLRRFRFAHHEERGRRRPTARGVSDEVGPERTAGVVVPPFARDFALAARLRQGVAVARRTFADVIASRHSLVPLAAILSFVFVGGWDAGFVLDTPTWPLTYVVLRDVIGQIRPLVLLLVGLYAGEIVWREREVRASDIADATPLPNWVALAGRFAALLLGIVVLQAVCMAAGIVLQLLRGVREIDLSLYVQVLFGLHLADYVLWAVLATLIHVLVGNKYAAHMLFVLYCAFYLLAPMKGWLQHNLLRYPAAPAWTYSDMTGFAPFLRPYLWFKSYWAGWALLLVVVATLFWPRGRDLSFRRRLRDARTRLTRPAAAVASVALLLIAALGGFVFYNTNVLNDYRTRDERARSRAEYERRYKQYETLTQPRVTGARLHVELHPQRRAAEVRGTFALVNRGARPIDAIHLVLDDAVSARSLTFDRAARAVVDDREHGYRIFALGRPLQPGQTMQFHFDLGLGSRGFGNSGTESAVLPNGTYFTHDSLPVIGYDNDRELTGDGARREHGLPPRRRPSIHDAARTIPRNSEWFHSDVVIGTDAREIALAPGALHRTWRANGRRYFHYRTDAPIKNVYAFVSSRYAVREDRWRDVEIRILHHPAHAFNVDRMIGSVKASLDYYTEQFGPYPYRQLSIAEVPRHAGAFARAFPGTVAYSEGFGFIARADGGIDYPFAVTAHEVAHQWWGGVFAPAEVPGRRVLLETLAHYSALMVMEKTHGRAEVERFLELMSHRYLIGRQNRRGSEVPLLLSDDQKYIHYDKGAVAMYALRDAIGEERVNAALRRFLSTHRFGRNGHPTSLDLYAELQSVTPQASRTLLKDLFEEITVWELRTTAARAEPAGPGRTRVTLEVEAYKLKADSIGRDERVPMDDLMDIGVFAAPREGEARGRALYLRKHRIRSGQQTITVVVTAPPATAGIDPHHRLIDRQRTDNVVAVAGTAASGD